MLLAGFALSECADLSSRMYLVFEGLTVMIHCGLVSFLLPGSTLYMHVCHPRGALLAPGLAGCLVGRGK